MASEDQVQKKKTSRKKVVIEKPGDHLTDQLSEEEIAAREEEAKRDAGESSGAGTPEDQSDSSEDTTPPEKAGKSSKKGLFNKVKSDSKDAPELNQMLEDAHDLGLQQEVNDLLVRIEVVCLNHGDYAKKARRHIIAAAFSSLAQVARNLHKQIRGVQYWKVQS